MTIEEIKAIASKYETEYEYVGIRTQEEPFELGHMTHRSHIWEDGEDTGEMLDGVSCTSVKSKAVAMHCDGKRNNPGGYYYGDHVAIICGNTATLGEDEGELIIEGAVVVEIIK